MTQFNPENKTRLTYGESLGPAMSITDQEDANQYFAAYVAFIQGQIDRGEIKDKMTAAEIAKANLGYFAGYGDQEQFDRVMRLFDCAHPFFGKHYPTPASAAAMANRN